MQLDNLASLGKSNKEYYKTQLTHRMLKQCISHFRRLNIVDFVSFLEMSKTFEIRTVIWVNFETLKYEAVEI